MTIAVAGVHVGRTAMIPRGLTLDFRLVAFGALLPDLIDKPLKWFLFPDALPDDHVFGHTLLVPVMLAAFGMVLVWLRRDARLVGLGLGCFTHLLVDPVVLSPRTLFWPALGTEFPDAHSFVPAQWAIDAVLATAYSVLWWRRPSSRGWVRRFLRTGALTGDCSPSGSPATAAQGWGPEPQGGRTAT